MIVTAGKTNVSVYYYIVQDASAASPGEPVLGLLFSDIETGGSASYARQGAARVDLTLVTLASASAAHTDGGFILVDDTNMPGLYRCDYPDLAFATGVDQVFLQLVVASAKNAVVAPLLVDLSNSLVALARGLAQGATSSTIQLAASETFADNELTGNTIKITSGTGAGQARVCVGNTGSTDTASIAPVWTTTPDSTSVYEIIEGSANVSVWVGKEVPGPTITGVPLVDLTHIIGTAQSAADLKDFADDGYDPGTNKVQGVVLVDTTTANTDMRGTDSALLAADINLTAGAIDNVTLVATTTTNTDMRGTDSAALASVCTETRLSELDEATGGKMANQVDVIQTDTTTDIPASITALNDISVADILTTQMTQSFSADGVAPTLTEALFLIQQMLGDFAISGTTLTVREIDGSTTAATFTLDSATVPTSLTRAT